ncbi:DUF1934 domain-containing protein [Cohnella faecalis]|uniref:DUF1934 domain-containing protein n=1 Tax=Cohnella faecalis TaxID=2315694 RepID=A0A398CGI9_9BACL|nr:DUF1934 domain-containing protein [Cohnella faecalis]RIE01062.1 DUF1934 domain-containing protein [Cohnella faecalis]
MPRDGASDEKALVRIRLESDAGGEKQEQSLEGEWYSKNRTIYLRYEETEGANLVRTLLSWKDGRLRLVRQGDVESEQIFSAGGRHSGYYRSDNVQFPLETETSFLRIVSSGGEGPGDQTPSPKLPMLLEWHYTLRIAGEDAGLFVIRLHAESIEND